MRRVPAIVLCALVAMPALAAEHWVRLTTPGTTPDFELYTSAGEKQGKDALRHFERVREFFLQASPVRGGSDVPLRIFQFDTESQFQPYRPNEHTAGYFISTPAREYIVIGNQTTEAFGPAIHEYVHLIVRHSGLKIPTWLNEGWADVYSTLRPLGKGIAVGDLQPDRMRILTTEQWLDFDTLTSVDTKSPIYNEAARVGIFYAESWALVHMLYLSSEYKANFGKFVMALHKGKSASEACQIAFDRSADAVFADLHKYFDRKKIYGAVFETRIGPGDAEIASAPMPEFDSRLALADLLVAIGKRNEAKEEYARLEKEQPDRADLDQSIGSLALLSRDAKTAREYFARAFDAGSADPQLCFDLAILERDAMQPPAKIIPILERSLQSKPDFTAAKVQLGMTRLDARDFDGAISTLMSIPKITPQFAPAVYCGLGYARVENGDLKGALRDVETCRQWAKTDADISRADRIRKLIDARSKPSAAVRPGEKLQRVAGIARNVECSAEGNRLQITVVGKVATFDLPEADAVELPAAPSASFTFACGPQQPIRMGVEFAPPRSAIETSLGIVRRLDY
jgi:tetratricopeptide (TPR) repeat protein